MKYKDFYIIESSNIDSTPNGRKPKEVKIGESTISYSYDGNEFEIFSLRTPRNKRGKGYAKAAMQQFIKNADSIGANIRLGSSPLDNKTNGNKLFLFYKSLGFEPTGRKINPVGDMEMIRPSKKIFEYKDFYSYLIIEGQSASDIEYEYDDYLQENPETNPIEDIKAVLDNMKVAYKEVEIPFSNNSYILTDQSIIEFDPKAKNYPLTFHKKDRFLYDSDFSEIESNVEETFNKDFWDHPVPLYHATRDENVDDIRETGLDTSSGTGINNRGTRGVFTVSDVDRLVLGEYGNNIFKIDTVAMKQDGITPYVSMEPDVLDGAVRVQIAHIIGDNRYSPDSYDGQWEETVIVGGRIDPKYLTLLDK